MPCQSHFESSDHQPFLTKFFVHQPTQKVAAPHFTLADDFLSETTKTLSRSAIWSECLSDQTFANPVLKMAPVC